MDGRGRRYQNFDHVINSYFFFNIKLPEGEGYLNFDRVLHSYFFLKIRLAHIQPNFMKYMSGNTNIINNKLSDLIQDPVI